MAARSSTTSKLQARTTWLIFLHSTIEPSRMRSSERKVCHTHRDHRVCSGVCVCVCKICKHRHENKHAYWKNKINTRAPKTRSALFCHKYYSCSSRALFNNRAPTFVAPEPTVQNSKRLSKAPVEVDEVVESSSKLQYMLCDVCSRVPTGTLQIVKRSYEFRKYAHCNDSVYRRRV